MDPITLGALAGMALSGVVGNHADRWFCTHSQNAWRKLREGTAEPRNGDLHRAIRRAQLLAVKIAIAYYNDLPHPRWRDSPGYSAEDISTPLLAWINRALVIDEPWTTDLDAQRRIEERIERAFTHPEPHDGPAAQRQRELRDIAADLTVDEVRQHVPNATDWPRFEMLLRQDGDPTKREYPGWWRLFRAFLAEEIKHNEAVRAILAQQGIARILELQTDLVGAVAALQTGLEMVLAQFGPDLADLRAAVARLEGTAGRIETKIHDIPNNVQAVLRQWHGIKLDTGREAPLRERIQIRPTELLLARYRIAPFVDCGGVLASICDWVIHPSERRAIGRLYVAPGGFGKTRLAVELFIQLDSLGWRCGFISQADSEDLTAGALTDLMTGNGAVGVCLAVDWAEAESSRSLIMKIASVARAIDLDGPPIRIIAFARSAQGWWDAFAGEHPQSAIFDPTPFAAIERELSEEDRRAIFTQSRSAFVAKLSEVGVPRRGQSQNPDLSNADRALLVVAIAFIDAIGVDRGDRSVLQILYEEERRYWRRALKVDSDRKASDLARAVAQVALVEGATIAGATTLIRADDTDRRFPIPDILDELEHRYGVQTVLGHPSRPEREAVPFISPLEPDLLAEHTCIEVLRESGFSLLSATLRAALTGPPLFRDDAARVMSVLVRAAHPSHDQRIRQGAERAIAVVGELVPQLTASQIGHLANSLPPRSIALSELAVTVARRLAEVAPHDSSEAALRQRADTQSYLSARLSHRGSHEDALAASEEAVKLHRQLVAANRTDGLRGLSSALHLHSQNLIELGRRRQAVEPSEEAVQLNRELAETNPKILGPSLAESLRNLGEVYASIGRNAEALQAVIDASVRFETLAVENPDEFLPALPGVLNSLSNRHIAMQQWKEALDATSKAVDIERRLVAGNRDAYLPGLANTLNNWSRDLLVQGRTEEASTAIDEAVNYHRELIDKNRNGNLLGLALALKGSGEVHFDAGQHERGLEVMGESIRFLRELVEKGSDRAAPDLAAALADQGIMLAKLERFREALLAFEEGAKVIRPYAIKFPEAYNESFLKLRNLYESAGAALNEQRLKAEPEPYKTTVSLAIPEGSTVFDEADKLLQIVGQGLGAAQNLQVGNGLTEEEADTRLSYVQAAEKAFPELANFLSKHADDESLEPIRKVAAFYANAILPPYPAGESEAEKLRKLHLNLNRARAKVHPEDSEARRRFAHALISNADDPVDGPGLVQELHDLYKAYPEDPFVREWHATALWTESKQAAHNGDDTIYDMKRNELRNLLIAYPDDPQLQGARVMSLRDDCRLAIETGDVGRLGSFLNELRTLAAASPDNLAVQLSLAEALFDAGIVAYRNDPQDVGLIQESASIAFAHPDDEALSEFARARFVIGPGQEDDQPLDDM